jgi:hypothetical protein
MGLVEPPPSPKFWGSMIQAEVSGFPVLVSQQ